MNVYLDSNVIVKCYADETGSSESLALMKTTEYTATSLISGAEVVAAISKAVRTGTLNLAQGAQARQKFLGQWPAFRRVPLSEQTILRAARLAWDYQLRGNDAVHLAAALEWQEELGETVKLATFDRELWLACEPAGLQPWPARLPR